MGKKQDYEENLRIARSVSTMINTTGWQEVIKPAIEDEKKDAIKTLCDATKLDREYFKSQGKVEMINTLRGLIDFCLQQGEVAGEKLDKLNQKSS